MTKEFVLQDPGEGLHEAEISEVHVGEGDTIEEDDVLLTVETDKVSVEIPAPFSGTIEDLRVGEGDQVRVGEVLLTYDEAGGDGAAETPDEEPTELERGESSAEEEDDESSRRGDAGAETETTTKHTEKETAETTRDAHDRRRPVPASPATRRLARELDVDLHTVEASGPEGRVTADDVRAAAGEGGEGAAEPAREPTPAAAERADFELPRLDTPGLPDFDRFGPTERMPLRGVRRVTAKRMALAASQVAAVTHHDVADVTDLERLRRRWRDDVEEMGGKLTPTIFAMKAVVTALQEYPRFNASLDVGAEEIVLKRHYHLGIAVDTGRGLLVPVIHDVDRKSLRDLAVEFTELAERTRNGDATRDDLTGGTFTITNPGAIGGTGFTPIVNWPEVAILGMGQARLETVVEGDLDDHASATRLRLPLSLTFDHRVVDGAEAARFVRRVVDLLDDPESLMIDA
jgi:pyruvate dehydrogenase E2 component (dihydrolipoamide acetyltransferase)